MASAGCNEGNALVGLGNCPPVTAAVVTAVGVNKVENGPSSYATEAGASFDEPAKAVDPGFVSIFAELYSAFVLVATATAPR